MPKPIRTLPLAVTASLAFLLTACGQTGPLKLPEAEQREAQAATDPAPDAVKPTAAANR
jgi:predicted small lipoprotein YifL